VASDARDDAAPARPTLRYTGPENYAPGALTFESSPFSDPQGAESFAAIEWRLAEVGQLRDGPASLAIRGKFMGTGETQISGIMRAPQDAPDLELKIKIAGTQIRSMNNLLRAYGNFDVVGGVFSCYSELTLDDGSIRGYVKPLVRKLKVYDKAQDRDKTAFEKVREGAIEDLSNLLENVPRDEVATKADLSGDVNRPQTETVQVVMRLIQNAFFKAILPGFDACAIC